MVDENVMIDLETLGTESDAVILSIGAVWFDRYNVDESEGYYATLNWQDQLDRGGTVTEGTLRFWLNQSRQARDAILNKKPMRLEQTLIDFDQWFNDTVKKPRDCLVWSKGPQFDLALLRDLYRRTRRPSERRPWITPWPYWSERDVRTALMLVPQKIARAKGSVAHHAFYDAVYQANQVRRFLISCGGFAKKPTQETKVETEDLLS
jgi:exodeoxyribonuclease VIII